VYLLYCSGATAALKLVGEAFPWTSPPGWAQQQPRSTPPGGFSDVEVGPVTPCGAVAGGVDSTNPKASNFVYLR
jgi:hypothetical protein